MKNKLVYQIKVELQHITPAIWRRIEVPSTYTFWDLHVAIQDAMGWMDYHLHAFRFKPKGKTKQITIGIPDDFDEDNTQAGWAVPISRFFEQPGIEVQYDYDFGDGWCHNVLLEGILLADKQQKYPRCSDGQQACPPEDCGGVPGYQNLITMLNNPEDEGYEDMISWLMKHVKNYESYNPVFFSPEQVKFDNPKKRFKKAFSE
jgi:hypothetical protein